MFNHSEYPLVSSSGQTEKGELESLDSVRLIHYLVSISLFTWEGIHLSSQTQKLQVQTPAKLEWKNPQLSEIWAMKGLGKYLKFKLWTTFQLVSRLWNI